jgi:hypothetical protein
MPDQRQLQEHPSQLSVDMDWDKSKENTGHFKAAKWGTGRYGRVGEDS